MAQQGLLAGHGQDRADPPGADQFAAMLADKFHPGCPEPLHHPLQLAGIDGPSVIDRLAQLLHPNQPEFADLLGIEREDIQDLARIVRRDVVDTRLLGEPGTVSDPRLPGRLCTAHPLDQCADKL